MVFGFSKKLRKEITISRKFLPFFTIFGILEVSSTGLFFYAIKLTENPAIVSFIENIGPIYVLILGYIFLKERFTKWEIIGMIITISGAIVLNYNKSFTWQEFFFEGAGVVFLSSFISSVGIVLAKSKIKEIHPWLLSINRILFIFTGFLILFLLSKESIHIPRSAFFNILVGSLLGPFLAVIVGYYALKYLKVSKISVIGTSKSFLILLASFFFFGVMPHSFQIAGGILMIVGVIMITISKVK